MTLKTKSCIIILWLSMNLYNFVWLCINIYDQVWLCMKLYDSVWLYIWICKLMYDFLRLCKKMYDYAWLCMYVCFYTVMYGYVCLNFLHEDIIQHFPGLLWRYLPPHIVSWNPACYFDTPWHVTGRREVVSYLVRNWLLYPFFKSKIG